MEENHRSSSSTISQEPLSLKCTNAQLIFKALAEMETCKLLIPTLDGTNYSDTFLINSSMSRTTKCLMFTMVKMQKEPMFKCGPRTMAEANCGISSILINRRRSQLPDSIDSTVSTLTDHSSSNQDFQWAESWK